jgi:transposase
MDTRQPYPSDLTNEQWAQVERFIPAPKPGGRPAKYQRREIVNALLYLNRTGCQWRALPHDLPPWKGAIAPVPELSALFLWLSSTTRLESADSGRGSLEW